MNPTQTQQWMGSLVEVVAKLLENAPSADSQPKAHCYHGVHLIHWQSQGQIQVHPVDALGDCLGIGCMVAKGRGCATHQT